ncbi:MAG: hypothetical protein JW820_05730 [Spirochaetales bacterium]|nr:hypothetical protein [Spirochaetales bacterium]
MGKSRLILALALLLLSASLIQAQEVSEKQEIAIFRLSHYGWGIPEAVLGGVDEEIRGVFINIGRFTVFGMSQRLEPGDVDEFIDRLKRYKEQRVELPEEVQMGREYFTQADFDRLVGSFIVVVPSVAGYLVVQEDDGDYNCKLKTSFTFLNVEEGTAFAQAFVDTEGTADSPEAAVRAALDGIAPRLTFEIRKIPAFQLKTGVLEVRGGEVILELGQDMGIKVGDEFLLVSTRVLESGRTYTTDYGLIVIKEVSDEVSVGKVIYARPRPEVGDQLRELPRAGLDLLPYLNVAVGWLQEEPYTVLLGARAVASRGFYSFRPFAGLEVPLRANIALAIPMNLYVGGEYNVYLGRLQVVPSAAIGIGGAYLWYLGLADVEEEKRFVFTHVGGRLGLSVNYLFGKNFRFTLDGGYLHWFSLIPKELFGVEIGKPIGFPSYDGVYVGAGLSIKL